MNHITSTQYSELIKCSQNCEETYEARNVKIRQISSTPKATHTWTDDEIKMALKEKSIHKGILSIPKRYKGEKSVSISQTKYYLADNHEIRALPDDTIAVQILPQSEWQPAPIGTRKLISSSERDWNEYDKELFPPVPTARLIRILEETGRRTVVATFQQEKEQPNKKKYFHGASDMILVTPMDVRYPKIRISGKNHQQWANKRILVGIDSWNVEDQYANGHFVRLIGPIGDLETEVSATDER